MPEFNLTPSGTHAYVKHDETGAVWECPLEYLEFGVRRGWSAAEAPEAPEEGLYDAPPAPPAEPEQTSFDPSEHTVSEVNDYLSLHAEQSPGEVARVIELEQADKARTGILDGPYGTAASDEPPSPTNTMPEEAN